MLANSGLYFSRADLLGDPFEGSFPRPNRGIRDARYQQMNAPEDILNRMPEFDRQMHFWTRLCTFVNCWHMNEQESAGMCRLYARSSEAVAIRTTVAKLKAVLVTDCHVGIVKYVNYSSASIPENNALHPFLHKRLSFAHEREVRAVVQHFPVTDGAIVIGTSVTKAGLWKTFSLKELVEKVFVAPTAPEWFKQLIEHVVEQYGLEFHVIQSSLDDEPFF